MFWLCSGEIKSQYPKYCLTAAWRVLVTLYFSAIISPLNKTNCWRIFFPNIDGVKSTALWNSTKKDNINSSVQFSCSVVSDSLRPHGLQHTRPPCPSPIPRAYSNSCPSSRWCHPTISSSIVPFSSCLQFCPVSGVFSNESVLRIRWPKYWSFSSNQQRLTFSLQLSYPPVY